ncbi:MAG: glycosyltransferase family 2 protein [Elusimicrobia bacterium]|nr:glycosyltransferase family 2 protein [Elusimicrobiota bacterium]
MPQLSVNLCCWNSAKTLDKTLNSVWAQTWTDYEVVAVDDGSTDSTPDILEKHRAAGRPLVVHRQKNAGLGAARNKAQSLSKGELLAILDHDDLWEPTKLERQVPLFRRREVVCVGSDAVYIDADGKPFGRYSDRVLLRRGTVLRELTLYNFVPCAAAVMRRSAVELAGGWFKPDFKIAEEYELFLRLAGVGEFDFVSEPLVRVRVLPGSLGWDVSRERAEMRRIYAELFARHPALEKELGPAAARVKRAGLWLSPEQADALAGLPASPKARLSAAALSAAARAGDGAVDALLGLKRGASRLREKLR